MRKQSTYRQKRTSPLTPKRRGQQKIAVIYWDVVNEVRKLAEKRTQG